MLRCSDMHLGWMHVRVQLHIGKNPQKYLIHACRRMCVKMEAGINCGGEVARSRRDTCRCVMMQGHAPGRRFPCARANACVQILPCKIQSERWRGCVEMEEAKILNMVGEVARSNKDACRCVEYQ